MKSFTILIILFSVITLSLFVVTPVTARTFLGSGGTTCGDYFQIKRVVPDAAKGIDLWLLGYVSGLNFMNYASRKIDLLQQQDSRDVLSFVSGYCSTNPEKTLNNAANEYWIQLSQPVGR